MCNFCRPDHRNLKLRSVLEESRGRAFWAAAFHSMLAAERVGKVLCQGRSQATRRQFSTILGRMDGKEWRPESSDQQIVVTAIPPTGKLKT